jgi:hypothetical protein
MRKRTAVLLGLVALALLTVLGTTFWLRTLSASALGPLRPEATTLPADTRMIARLDLAAVRSSATWRRLMEERLPSRPPVSPLTRSRSAASALRGALDGLERTTGCRLERDVDEVIVAAGGASGKTRWALALLFGRFQADRVAATLASGAAACRPVAGGVEGRTLHVCHLAGRREIAVAFQAHGFAVVGSRSALEASLPSKARNRRALASNARLSGLLRRLPAGRPFWLVADDPAPLQPGDGSLWLPASVIPQSLTLAADSDGTLEVLAEMTDEASAKRLTETLRGLLALLHSQSPRLRTGPAHLDVASVLDQLQLASERRVTRLRMASGGTTAFASWLAEGLPGWVASWLAPRANPGA